MAALHTAVCEACRKATFYLADADLFMMRTTLFKADGMMLDTRRVLDTR
jgi:hypothetical protein